MIQYLSICTKDWKRLAEFSTANKDDISHQSDNKQCFSSDKITFISQKYRQRNNKTAYVVQKQIYYVFIADALCSPSTIWQATVVQSNEYIWIWHHACNIRKHAIFLQEPVLLEV